MPVTISFLARQFEASLAIIVLLFFLAGMITGIGALFWMRMRRKAGKRKDEAAGRKANGWKYPDLR